MLMEGKLLSARLWSYVFRVSWWSKRCCETFLKSQPHAIHDFDIHHILVRYGNGKLCHDNLIEMLTFTTPVYYSLLVDESNDRGVEAKDLVVLLRFFDISVMKAVTRFIDLPTANNGTAAAIFKKIDDCLTSHGLKYEHLLCFNSDTCNTMKGKQNGVVRHLMDKQPDMIDFGCICHLENLALKSAMKSLPITIDSSL